MSYSPSFASASSHRLIGELSESPRSGVLKHSSKQFDGTCGCRRYLSVVIGVHPNWQMTNEMLLPIPPDDSGQSYLPQPTACAVSLLGLGTGFLLSASLRRTLTVTVTT